MKPTPNNACQTPKPASLTALQQRLQRLHQARVARVQRLGADAQQMLRQDCDAALDLAKQLVEAVLPVRIALDATRLEITRVAPPAAADAPAAEKTSPFDLDDVFAEGSGPDEPEPEPEPEP
jgi:hypothetical protein